MISDHKLFVCSSCWTRKHRSWYDIKVGKPAPMNCMVCQGKVHRPVNPLNSGMLSDYFNPIYKLPRGSDE